MKTLAIFGSTGSIGRQTLEVLDAFPGEFKVLALTAYSQRDLLEEQAQKHGAKAFVAPTHEEIAAVVQQADFIINALPGFAGLDVSLATVQAGKTLLSANKESLAIAGKWLRQLAEKTGSKIYPLDSEASALWQLMDEFGPEALSSITLTCSGGPFYGKKAAELEGVTVKEALNHPTWKMGAKVSLDSATLINKVLEVYEVHQLFDIPLKDIHIVIHQQSLVHALIHTKTGATKMHLAPKDMRFFIAHALFYPNKVTLPWKAPRLRRSELTFSQPDPETFRSLKWLHKHKGNPNFPIVLNAMNDFATAEFLAGRLGFLDIYACIEHGLERFLWAKPPQSLQEAIAFHHSITTYYEQCDSFSRREIPASQAK